MVSIFVHSQAISRPGDLPTDIAGVGDVTDNVLGFNVSLYIFPSTLFSTLITCPQSMVSVSMDYFIFSSRHHGLDLFVQLVKLQAHQGSCGRIYFGIV